MNSILNHPDVRHSTLETFSGNGNPAPTSLRREDCNGHPLAQGGAEEMP